MELHVHLDGAVRPETAWELCKQKNLDLPGRGSLEDFKQAIAIHKPIDLQHFLKSFTIFAPAIRFAPSFRRVIRDPTPPESTVGNWVFTQIGLLLISGNADSNKQLKML